MSVMSSFSYLSTIIKVRLLGTRRQSGTVPAGGRSPIWPGTGTLPRPRPRFVRVRNRGLSPVRVICVTIKQSYNRA